MINSRELIDRFGDVEFLNELWQKARSELPGRLDELRPYMESEAVASSEDLAKRVHKLRGLVSNFLTEKRALPMLADCENLLEEHRNDELAPLWEQFESALDDEVGRLDRWLAEHGCSPNGA